MMLLQDLLLLYGAATDDAADATDAADVGTVTDAGDVLTLHLMKRNDAGSPSWMQPS